LRKPSRLSVIELLPQRRLPLAVRGQRDDGGLAHPQASRRRSQADDASGAGILLGLSARADLLTAANHEACRAGVLDSLGEERRPLPRMVVLA
jgi:hypothetical protein